ncbi:MAG: DUF5677 domain-containing protein [Sedimentisphaerales bacterium]
MKATEIKNSLATELTEDTEKKISTKIDTVINQWFQETVDKINKEIKTDTFEDTLCPSILPLAYKYCCATLTLLNNGFKLPAMALIRILAEITFRLCWSGYKDNPQKELPDVRIQRWLKESYKEQKKHLKKLLPSSNCCQAIEINKEISYLENEIKKIPYSFAGSLYNSLQDLNKSPLNLRDKLYPLLYGNFNKAIHPDLLLLTSLVKEDKDKITFSGDLNDISTDDLKIYLMTCAFWVVSLVKINYEWDYNNVKTQYLELKKLHKDNTKNKI